MQIILQKSEVYLIFYVFLSKILSIFTINTINGQLIYRAACVHLLHFVYCTLPLCTLFILLPAEDEEVT